MIVIDAAEDPGMHNGAEAVTEWHLLGQQRVTDFADAGVDHNPLHVDPDFARTTPYGSTIAHGYYFMAIAPSLLETRWQFTGFSFAIAYGVNRIRFPAETHFRLRPKIVDIEEIPNGIQVRTNLTFDSENLERPVCVAESLYRAYR